MRGPTMTNADRIRAMTDEELAIEGYKVVWSDETGGLAMTNKIASVTYIPPCWCHGSKGYDIEHECYIDPPTAPVYVCINGRRRRAKRWLWLWRLVARVQEGQM